MLNIKGDNNKVTIIINSEESFKNVEKIQKEEKTLVVKSANINNIKFDTILTNKKNIYEITISEDKILEPVKFLTLYANDIDEIKCNSSDGLNSKLYEIFIEKVADEKVKNYKHKLECKCELCNSLENKFYEQVEKNEPYEIECGIYREFLIDGLIEYAKTL